MPAISIIVPVYNSQTYLKECVESVLTQSFSEWELILVDDGSTDGSNDICKRFASTDHRIRVITKPNGGLSSARNAGLDIAKGKYMFFLDADDELYPYSLSHLYEIAEANNADITIGRAAYTETKPDCKPTNSTITLASPRELCIDILYQKPGTDNSACWRLFHHSLFDNLRFYNGWYEDLEIFHKLLMNADTVAVTDCVVYFYRKHTESFINSWSEGRRDNVKVTESILQLYSSDPAITKAAQSRYFSANYNLLLALLHNRPDDNEAIHSCLHNIKSLRRTVLSDPNSRFKNRMGALLSYFGLNTIKRLS